jgi:acyl-CoA thioester hydrolase
VRRRVNHETRIKIRWRDMDAYGHVNNAVFLNYLEECREAWDFVLVHVSIDYRRQLTQADGEIVTGCRVTSFGRSSVRTAEEIRLADGTLVAESQSVIVPRARDTAASRPLTPHEREVLQAEIERTSG